MPPVSLQQALLVSILGFPVAAVAILGVFTWIGVRFSEKATSRIVGMAFLGATLASAVLLCGMLLQGTQEIRAPMGAWFHVEHYSFPLGLLADRLSIPFALFVALLTGLTGAFSRRYLHQEQSFLRYYLLLAVFGAGVELVVLAGSLDLAFFGWEAVGLSSALLVAYFCDRRKPVEHGLRAFLTYRFCDIGFLAAAVWLHHTTGTPKLVEASAQHSWAGFASPAGAVDATIVGLLLLWASMGKAAQFPLGGWLPRAMEGPTPSSAIFYGSISVHLGPYLLLRAAPILEASPIATGAVIVIGALTAAHGTFVGRAQTDIKSALGYATMTQVGLIFVEIGFGFRYLALFHILGHAAIRTLQILRSPSLLHDHHKLNQSMGTQSPPTGVHLERLVPKSAQPWLYRFALERGYLDALLKRYVVGGFLKAMRLLDSVDSGWTRSLERPKPQNAEVTDGNTEAHADAHTEVHAEGTEVMS